MDQQTDRIPPPPPPGVVMFDDPSTGFEVTKPPLLRFGALAAIIALAAGIAAGYAFGHIPVTPAPAPVTHVQTVTTDVTPQACLDALDMADRSFGLASKALTAVSHFRFAEATRYIHQINARAYNAAKAECRASG